MSNRPPGSRAGRPGSRAGGFNTGYRPPGTALPPGTRGGRQTSDFNMSNRPMTGMKGATRISTAAFRAGGQDKNSYVGLLRHKLTALEEEVERLTEELDTYNTESERYVAYEQRADVLSKELMELQGTLADYNMLVEKSHINSDIDDIVKQTKRLKKKNEVEGKRIDAIFTERSSKDAETAKREAEIEKLKAKAEAELNSLPPEALQAYRKAEKENKQYSSKIQQLQVQLDNIGMRSASMEEELHRDPNKQRAMTVYEKRSQLLAKKNELETEKRMAAAAGPEDRDRLLQRVKEDNQEIAVMERHISELQAAIDRQQAAIASMEQEETDRQSERYEKYVQVVAKDKDMQKYIDDFPQAKEAQLKDIEALEGVITALLEHISGGIDRQHNLPDAKAVKSMESNLQFQSTQAANAERTLASLKKERAARQTDLKKLAVMNKKVYMELEDLKIRTPRMQEELKVFSDLNKLKADGKAVEEKLEKQRTEFEVRHKTLTKRVSLEKAKVEKLRADLNANDIHQALKGLEGNLSVYLQANIGLREFIEVRGRETDYQGKLSQCKEMLGEVNKLVMELTKHPAPL